MAVAAKPETYQDYVVRFSKPGTFMRSQVFRVVDEAAATDAALHAVEAGNWVGWSIVDVSTVAEAKERLGVGGG